MAIVDNIYEYEVNKRSFIFLNINSLFSRVGRAPDTPVKHSVAPLFIPQYLLGAYCIRAPFWMQGGGSDKTKSQLLEN